MAVNTDITGFIEGRLPDVNREIEYLLMGAIERGTVMSMAKMGDIDTDGIFIQHHGPGNVVQYFHVESLAWRYYDPSPAEEFIRNVTTSVTVTRETTPEDVRTLEDVAAQFRAGDLTVVEAPERVMTKHTAVSVKYDCGWNMVVTIPLGSMQSMLHQPAVGDLMIQMADQLHTQECGACAIAREEEGG